MWMEKDDPNLREYHYLRDELDYGEAKSVDGGWFTEKGSYVGEMKINPRKLAKRRARNKLARATRQSQRKGR